MSRGGFVRQAVEDAARATFVERGFEGTSVDEIARRAGVSKPTIYAHFGGKSELFVHILESYCARLLTPILDSAADDRTLEEVLRDFARGYTSIVLDREVVALHRLFVSEAQRFPELGRRYYDAGPQSVHDELARFFNRRIALGELREVDPQRLAEQFSGLLLTPIRLKMLFAVIDESDSETVGLYCETAIDLFLSGVSRSRRRG